MWTQLTEIDIGNSGDCAPTVRSNNAITEVKVFSSFSDNVPRHPVTLLCEICSNLKWPAPTYDLMNEKTVAKRHFFTLECKVLEHRAIGRGLNKKEAKCAASKALLEKLKELDDLEEFASVISFQMYIYDQESEPDSSSKTGTALNATSEIYKMCYARRWPLPVYGLLSVEGPEHNRLFTIGCTIPGLSELAEGIGHSKKEAKHAASLSLLDKILDNMSASPSSSCTTDFFHEQGNEYDSSYKHKLSKNATTLLYELCRMYKWPLPVYEYLPETGSTSRIIFTVVCSLRGYTELGSGYSKKEAKHASSSAVLFKMREFIEETLPCFRQNCISNEKVKAEYFCNIDKPKDPITSLHEICASRNWPYPSYTLLCEEDLPDNQKKFTIGCLVLGYTSLTKGSGYNKKMAKNAASLALLVKIKSNNGNCGSPLHIHTKNCICDVEETY